MIRSRVACPRANSSRISSAGLVQTKGSGLSFQWETEQVREAVGTTASGTRARRRSVHGSGPGALQQDDYVFCDSSLGESGDEVSVGEGAVTERHLSDHAPLIVDFDVGPIATADLSA